MKQYSLLELTEFNSDIAKAFTCQIVGVIAYNGLTAKVKIDGTEYVVEWQLHDRNNSVYFWRLTKLEGLKYPKWFGWTLKDLVKAWREFPSGNENTFNWHENPKKIS